MTLRKGETGLVPHSRKQGAHRRSCGSVEHTRCCTQSCHRNRGFGVVHTSFSTWSARARATSIQLQGLVTWVHRPALAGTGWSGPSAVQASNPSPASCVWYHHHLHLISPKRCRADSMVQARSQGPAQKLTRNLRSSIMCREIFWASIWVPSMPSSPYRNCTMLPAALRTVLSYLPQPPLAQRAACKGLAGLDSL